MDDGTGMLDLVDPKGHIQPKLLYYPMFLWLCNLMILWLLLWCYELWCRGKEGQQFSQVHWKESSQQVKGGNPSILSQSLLRQSWGSESLELFRTYLDMVWATWSTWPGFNRGLKTRITRGPCWPQHYCDSVSIDKKTLYSSTFFPVTRLPLICLQCVKATGV